MSSEVFELVAQNDVAFFVHKDLLGFHSQPFKEAASGVWKESNERKILLADWDAKTVGRLVQFLYTGDYKYPDPSPTDTTNLPVEKQELVPSLPEAPDDSKQGTLTTFLTCVESVIDENAHLPMTDSMWLERVDMFNFDFEETFLAHARVYCLAHYKAIPALKALARARLARTLLKLHPLGSNPHLAINIVNLASYVYSNTDSLSNSEEPLRKVISHYVASNFAFWQTEPAAVELMCGGGDFVRDVLTKYRKRFGDLGPQGLAPPGTRYIKNFHVGWPTSNTSTRLTSDSRHYPKDTNHLSTSRYWIAQLGKRKTVLKGTYGRSEEIILADLPMQSIWLIPDYTTDVDMAATHFYVSHTEGFSIANIIGRQCGSNCRIERNASKDVRDKIIAMAFIQCNTHYLDIGKFREFDGIVSHVAHKPFTDSFHILWKTIKTAPV